MKPILTSDLKIKFLGITPFLKDRSGVLNTQEIVALSALLTFKGRSIKKLFEEIEKGGNSVSERIKMILQKSSLRGHASIATTPSICLTYEGSKFLDSTLTGIYFSSSLVSSGRRTGTTEKDIVFPKKIYANKKSRKIYQEASERIISFSNSLLDKKIQKDEASKILQYGIYGTGIIQLPIETIVGLKREYQKEKEWMPEEVGLLLKHIEKEAKKLGIDLLYHMRAAAPRNFYPYPNIFKNPNKTNLVRELRKRKNLKNDSELVSMDILTVSELEKIISGLEKEKKATFSSLTKIKQNWFKLLEKYQEIFRDYNLSLRLKILSSIPWRIWGEKKRHRTCHQIIESIYYCIERAEKLFLKFRKRIREGKVDDAIVRQIEEVFSIPPSIKKQKELLLEYLSVGLNSFEAYRKMVKLGIKPKDAIFVVSRAVKIDILQEYDLYNLLTGYYPLRLCQTAEEEMRRNTIKEVAIIKKALERKGLAWLNKLIVPKCGLVGFCPEEKSCPMILSLVKGYNEKFHQNMKKELTREFEKNLKKLRK